ncbi:MAG: hypothetical protein HY721_27670 [Planctomycetes bacterium]|nr:hypothetical protein [Planctomycetota bacterium]
MMRQVELIFDRDCPNVAPARAALLAAFAEAGITAAWREWNRKAPESPPYVRGYGSPTILVNGRDIAGVAPTENADSCRVYRHAGSSVRGVPAVATIAAVLRSNAASTGGGKTRAKWRRALGVLPSVGASVLPVGVCPACWPAYAGVLGALGLGFLLETRYVLALSVVVMAVALGSLAYRARLRRGYGPLAVGTLGAVVVLIGKFVLSSGLLLYGGVAALLAAAVWNVWPKGQASAGPCSACTGGGRASEVTH